MFASMIKSSLKGTLTYAAGVIKSRHDFQDKKNIGGKAKQ